MIFLDLDREAKARGYLLDLGADPSILDDVLTDVADGALSAYDAVDRLGLDHPAGAAVWTVYDAIWEAAE